MEKASATGLRIVLILGGAFIVFTGLDIALGGMLTLGWMEQTTFIAVTDEPVFLVQDNHIRFLGGVWIGIGVLFLIAPTNLPKYRDVLNVAFALIFLGGLARFSQMHPEIIFGPDIIGSLLAELVGMPLLYVWLSRVVKAHTP